MAEPATSQNVEQWEAEIRRLLESAAYEMATLYYHMAKKFVETYGDGARDVIRQAIRDWGEEKGKKHLQNVLAMGLEPTLDNIRRGSTLPWARIMRGEPAKIEGDTMEITTTRCALMDVWRDHDALDLAKLYCEEVDVAKWKAFNDGIEVQKASSMAGGDECCHFELTIKDKE